MNTHFTAWMANDSSVLDQSCMDITVLEDELIGEDPEQSGAWASRGEPKFYAVTTVDARDGDAADGCKQAAELMEAAGWRLAGEWMATENSYTATVERDS